VNVREKIFCLVTLNGVKPPCRGQESTLCSIHNRQSEVRNALSGRSPREIVNSKIRATREELFSTSHTVFVNLKLSHGDRAASGGVYPALFWRDFASSASGGSRLKSGATTEFIPTHVNPPMRFWFNTLLAWRILSPLRGSR